MGIDDKIKHGVEGAVGKAKEAIGKANEDDEQVAEGKADQSEADLKKAADKAKDAFKR